MINPVALKLGPLSIRWYGLAYLAALGAGYGVMTRLNKTTRAFRDNAQILDLGFWLFLWGAIVGGRLGYVLFYDLPYFLANPLKIVALWEGGMSFHGGLIGAILAGLVFCHIHILDFWKVADTVAPAASLAQAIGRLGNFANRELPGRVITDPNWHWLGMDFGDGLLRYASPLIQAGENLLAFLILILLFPRFRKPGTILSAYLILNGLLRTASEGFREPDPQIGYLFGHLTLGQLLGLGVAAIGITLLILAQTRKTAHTE